MKKKKVPQTENLTIWVLGMVLSIKYLCDLGQVT